MPQEVFDIKKFIEICRRKDASCSSLPHLDRSTPRTGVLVREEMIVLLTRMMRVNSGADKAQSQDSADQVQGPVSSAAVYARVEGFGQGG